VGVPEVSTRFSVVHKVRQNSHALLNNSCWASSEVVSKVAQFPPLPVVITHLPDGCEKASCI